MSINKVILVGNLGQNPNIGEKEGFEYGSFNLATSKKWKDKNGETKEKTLWHQVRTLGAITKVCDYLEKGSKVYVEGELSYEEYEDKKSGGTKQVTKIIAHKIEIIKGKETGNNEHYEAKANGYQPQSTIGLVPQKQEDIEIIDDEIPF